MKRTELDQLEHDKLYRTLEGSDLFPVIIVCVIGALVIGLILVTL
jgi:hypothetical protein